MPDPAPPPGLLYWKADTTVTNEKYHEVKQNKNRIMAPPGYSPCVENMNQDRRKLNDSFLRSFFEYMESAVSFFWLYRKVKKGKLYGRSKNQNPVRRNGSLDGGYRRRVSELLPPMVAAEEEGTEEPGGNCWDNAPQESFFGRMKDHIKKKLEECSTYNDVKHVIDDWMDYYNNDRCQWKLAKLSPNEYYEYITTGIYPLRGVVPLKDRNDGEGN